MATKEFLVLYTHQKRKKAKVWQDGVLRVSEQGTRAALYGEGDKRLDQLHIKQTQACVGEELESEKYLITIEEVKPCAGNTAPVCPPADGENGDQSRVEMKPSHLPTSHLHAPASQASQEPTPHLSSQPPSHAFRRQPLKRRRAGFVPPRQLEKKPSLHTEDATSSSTSVRGPVQAPSFGSPRQASSLFSTPWSNADSPKSQTTGIIGLYGNTSRNSDQADDITGVGQLHPPEKFSELEQFQSVKEGTLCSVQESSLENSTMATSRTSSDVYFIENYVRASPSTEAPTQTRTVSLDGGGGNTAIADSSSETSTLPSHPSAGGSKRSTSQILALLGKGKRGFQPPLKQNQTKLLHQPPSESSTLSNAGKSFEATPFPHEEENSCIQNRTLSDPRTIPDGSTHVLGVYSEPGNLTEESTETVGDAPFLLSVEPAVDRVSDGEEAGRGENLNKIAAVLPCDGEEVETNSQITGSARPTTGSRLQQSSKELGTQIHAEDKSQNSLSCEQIKEQRVDQILESTSSHDIREKRSTCNPRRNQHFEGPSTGTDGGLKSSRQESIHTDINNKELPKLMCRVKTGCCHSDMSGSAEGIIQENSDPSNTSLESREAGSESGGCFSPCISATDGILSSLCHTQETDMELHAEIVDHAKSNESTCNVERVDKIPLETADHAKIDESPYSMGEVDDTKTVDSGEHVKFDELTCNVEEAEMPGEIVNSLNIGDSCQVHVENRACQDEKVDASLEQSLTVVTLPVTGPELSGWPVSETAIHVPVTGPDSIKNEVYSETVDWVCPCDFPQSIPEINFNIKVDLDSQDSGTITCSHKMDQDMAHHSDCCVQQDCSRLEISHSEEQVLREFASTGQHCEKESERTVEKESEPTVQLQDLTETGTKRRVRQQETSRKDYADQGNPVRTSLVKKFCEGGHLETKSSADSSLVIITNSNCTISSETEEAIKEEETCECRERDFQKTMHTRSVDLEPIIEDLYITENSGSEVINIEHKSVGTSKNGMPETLMGYLDNSEAGHEVLEAIFSWSEESDGHSKEPEGEKGSDDVSKCEKEHSVVSDVQDVSTHEKGYHAGINTATVENAVQERIKSSENRIHNGETKQKVENNSPVILYADLHRIDVSEMMPSDGKKDGICEKSRKPRESGNVTHENQVHLGESQHSSATSIDTLDFSQGKLMSQTMEPCCNDEDGSLIDGNLDKEMPCMSPLIEHDAVVPDVRSREQLPFQWELGSQIDTFLDRCHVDEQKRTCDIAPADISDHEQSVPDLRDRTQTKHSPAYNGTFDSLLRDQTVNRSARLQSLDMMHHSEIQDGRYLETEFEELGHPSIFSELSGSSETIPVLQFSANCGGEQGKLTCDEPKIDDRVTKIKPPMMSQLNQNSVDECPAVTCRAIPSEDVDDSVIANLTRGTFVKQSELFTDSSSEDCPFSVAASCNPGNSDEDVSITPSGRHLEAGSRQKLEKGPNASHLEIFEVPVFSDTVKQKPISQHLPHPSHLKTPVRRGQSGRKVPTPKAPEDDGAIYWKQYVSSGRVKRDSHRFMASHHPRAESYSDPTRYTEDHFSTERLKNPALLFHRETLLDPASQNYMYDVRSSETDQDTRSRMLDSRWWNSKSDARRTHSKNTALCEGPVTRCQKGNQEFIPNFLSSQQSVHEVHQPPYSHSSQFFSSHEDFREQSNSSPLIGRKTCLGFCGSPEDKTGVGDFCNFSITGDTRSDAPVDQPSAMNCDQQYDNAEVMSLFTSRREVQPGHHASCDTLIKDVEGPVSLNVSSFLQHSPLPEYNRAKEDAGHDKQLSYCSFPPPLQDPSVKTRACLKQGLGTSIEKDKRPAHTAERESFLSKVTCAPEHEEQLIFLSSAMDNLHRSSDRPCIPSVSPSSDAASQKECMTTSGMQGHGVTHAPRLMVDCWSLGDQMSPCDQHVQSECDLRCTFRSDSELKGKSHMPPANAVAAHDSNRKMPMEREVGENSTIPLVPQLEYDAVMSVSDQHERDLQYTRVLTKTPDLFDSQVVAGDDPILVEDSPISCAEDQEIVITCSAAETCTAACQLLLQSPPSPKAGCGDAARKIKARFKKIPLIAQPPVDVDQTQLPGIFHQSSIDSREEPNGSEESGRNAGNDSKAPGQQDDGLDEGTSNQDRTNTPVSPRPDSGQLVLHSLSEENWGWDDVILLDDIRAEKDLPHTVHLNLQTQESNGNSRAKVPCHTVEFPAHLMKGVTDTLTAEPTRDHQETRQQSLDLIRECNEGT